MLTKRKRWSKEDKHFHFPFEDWKGPSGKLFTLHIHFHFPCFTFLVNEDTGAEGGLSGPFNFTFAFTFRLMRTRIWVKEGNRGLSPSTWRSTPAHRPKTGFVICFYKLNHRYVQLCVHPQEGWSGWNCDREDNLLLLPWPQVFTCYQNTAKGETDVPRLSPL